MPPLPSHDGHEEVDEKENIDAGETGGEVVEAVGGEGLVAVRSDIVEGIFLEARLETGCSLADMHGHFVTIEVREFDDEGEECWACI